jgi:hypothetical protein
MEGEMVVSQDTSSSWEERRQPRAFGREIKRLFLASMAIFLVTVVIGMLNGLDLVEFNRPTLVTHVHAGTLGWITLGIFATTLWLFGRAQTGSGWLASSPRWLSWLAIVSIAIYTYTFYATTGIGRPIAGSLVFLAIVGFFLWTLGQLRRVEMTVPRLALLAAMINLVIGAVVGILLGLNQAGQLSGLPDGLFIAHPATMLVGYLILAGMAIGEWYLQPEVPAREQKLGIIQVLLPFLGALAMTTGALLDIFVLLILNVPLEILGVLIFLWRIGPKLVRLPWLKGSGKRLAGISILFIVINVGLIAYLIVTYAEDFDSVPPWLIFALDHAIFIGVMTNGLFAMIYLVTVSQRSVWAWSDHLLFWGMNIGLVGFVVGLITQEAVIKRIFSPIMGASILLAIIAYSLRLYYTSKAEKPRSSSRPPAVSRDLGGAS